MRKRKWKTFWLIPAVVALALIIPPSLLSRISSFGTPSLGAVTHDRPALLHGVSAGTLVAEREDNDRDHDKDRVNQKRNHDEDRGSTDRDSDNDRGKKDADSTQNGSPAPGTPPPGCACGIIIG